MEVSAKLFRHARGFISTEVNLWYIFGVRQPGRSAAFNAIGHAMEDTGNEPVFEVMLYPSR